MLVSVADVFKTENHTVIVIGQLVVFLGGLHLGIRVGVVPPGSPYPDPTVPTSDQKKPFFTSVFRSGLQNPYPISDLASNKLCRHYLDYNANTEKIKISKIHFEFAYIWNWNDKYVHTLPKFPRKPYPPIRANNGLIPVFRPKRLKNPTLWGDTNIYGLYKGVPLPPPPGSL